MNKTGRRFGRAGANLRLEEIWADPEEIGGTIRKMERNYPSLQKKVFIITEGPYDYEFYSRFFNSEKCEIRFANSRKNVISVIKSLLKKIPGEAPGSVIGIVDRDFSFFTGPEGENYENVFMTDSHDIETMIISDEMIEKVLEYYERKSSAGRFRRNTLMAIRQGSMLSRLIECSRLVGLSLFVNEKYGLNMTFKHLNCKKKNIFIDFTDPSALVMDEERLMEVIEKRNKTKFADFREALSKELSGGPDLFDYPMQICRGHDLMCVLLADININYPQDSGSKVRSRDLERLFRRLYGREEFYKTDLYRELKGWAEEQGKNPGELFS